MARNPAPEEPGCPRLTEPLQLEEGASIITNTILGVAYSNYGIIYPKTLF